MIFVKRSRPAFEKAVLSDHPPGPQASQRLRIQCQPFAEDGFGMFAEPGRWLLVTGRPPPPRRLHLFSKNADQLILEYEAVCKREQHLSAAGMSIMQAGVFVDALAALVEPVESHFIWRPQLKDPSDEMVLEAAVNGQAQAIVTFNQRDFGTVPKKFGLRLLLPRDACKRILE